MVDVKYCLVLFLLCGQCWSQHTLNEGEQCSDPDNKVGICSTLKDCPLALDGIRQGKRPELCSFVGRDPIICCTTRTTTSNRPPKLPKDQRISENQCKQYEEVIQNNLYVSTLSFDSPATKVTTFECKDAVSLIVGGTKTLKGEFPHMAALGWPSASGEISWGCGASIISEQWLLSAGHCKKNYNVEPTIVRMGTQRLDDPNENHINRKIVRLVTPPEYTISSSYNDIMLVQVDNKIVFNKNLRPACLWHENSINTDTAVAIGWGQTSDYEFDSKDLLKVTLNIYDNSVCTARFPIENYRKLKQGIVDSQLCAGNLEGGHDTCQGDSGGPLQITLPKIPCVYYIVGVTSFGKMCGAVNEAAVYTRISSYIDWIESIVWG